MCEVHAICNASACGAIVNAGAQNSHMLNTDTLHIGYLAGVHVEQQASEWHPFGTPLGPKQRSMANLALLRESHQLRNRKWTTALIVQQNVMRIVHVRSTSDENKLGLFGELNIEIQLR
jgi:hypothetical protein